MLELCDLTRTRFDTPNCFAKLQCLLDMLTGWTVFEPIVRRQVVAIEIASIVTSSKEHTQLEFGTRRSSCFTLLTPFGFACRLAVLQPS